MRAAALPWLMVGLASLAASAGACGSGFSSAPGTGGSAGAGSGGSTSSSSGTTSTASSGSTSGSQSSSTGTSTSSSGAPGCGTSEVKCGQTCTSVLSDPANCGACGYSCGTDSCIAGACQIVAPGGVWSGVGDGAELILDAANVYWTTGEVGTGAVYSVPKTGGSVGTIESGQDQPRGIATDGTRLFWANTHAGTVMQEGTNGTGLSTLASGQTNPTGVAYDAASNSVFWTNNVAGTGSVSQLAVGGTVITTVASNLGNPPAWIVVGGANVFWTTPDTVESAPVGGLGVHTIVAMGQSGAHGITAGGTGIFWANSTGGEIMALTKGAAVMPVLSTLASGQSGPLDIATDGTTVFWGNSLANTIAAVPITGSSTVVQLAASQSGPRGMAVDATSVYWLDVGTKAVFRAAK